MPAPPLRKISDTILDFGEPLISQTNMDASGEGLRSALKIVILVWNAHVLAMPRWWQAKSLADLHEKLHDPAMPAEMVRRFAPSRSAALSALPRTRELSVSGAS